MSNGASPATSGDLATRLCSPDTWDSVLDDPAPRAIRWAVRDNKQLFAPEWSKWHYTEGNGLFTACSLAVVPFGVDGSPEEKDLRAVTCKRCLKKMALSKR
jgi:hypothetical protein